MGRPNSRGGLMHLTHQLLVVAIALAIPATSHSQEAPSGSGIDTVRFAPALGVDLARASVTWSGAYIRDIANGRGDVASQGEIVTVRFRAWLPSGSSVGGDSAHIATFRLGAGVVMPGLDQGVSGMRVGGRRQIVVPPDLQGSGGIPRV